MYRLDIIDLRLKKITNSLNLGIPFYDEKLYSLKQNKTFKD